MKNKVKNNFYHNLKNKSDRVEINCDYLRLLIRNKDFFKSWSSLLQDINGTNSNECILNIDYNDVYEIKITKSYTTTDILYFFEYVGEFGTYTLFRISENIVQRFKSCENNFGTVDIYGAFFRLQEIEQIDYDLFDVLGIDLQELIITRYDYKLDFFGLNKSISPKQVLTIQANQKAPLTEYRNYTGLDYKLVSGWSFGYTNNGQSKTKNKVCHIRMYDKILDSIEKGKETLYNDYLKYEREHNKKIFRLEFEFGVKFCQARGEIMFKNLEKIEQQIKEYLHLKPKEGVFTKRYELHNSINDMIPEKRKKYFKVVNTMVDNIERAGYNFTEIRALYLIEKHSKKQGVLPVLTITKNENIDVCFNELINYTS